MSRGDAELTRDYLAFAVDEHYRAMFRFAWRLVGSREEAEDIVHDVFASLVARSATFQPRTESLWIYLLGAVRNQARKCWRSPCPEPLNGEPPTRATEAEDILLMKERVGAVEEAIRRLPSNQQEVVVLAYYEGLPLADIAEITESEIGAVKTRLQRARQTLKGALSYLQPQPTRGNSSDRY